jgi:hypothetical protein
LPGPKYYKNALMETKISLKTCFALPGSDSERMPLPEGVGTVGDLINYMGGQIEYSFINPESGQLEEDLEIILNKKEIWFYPEALNTPLQDSDVVEIYLLPLGGG